MAAQKEPAFASSLGTICGDMHDVGDVAPLCVAVVATPERRAVLRQLSDVPAILSLLLLMLLLLRRPLIVAPLLPLLRVGVGEPLMASVDKVAIAQLGHIQGLPIQP